jgi:hypothetical protein
VVGPAACTTQSTQIDIGLGPNIGIIQTDVEVEPLLEGRRGCRSSCCLRLQSPPR